MMNGHLISNTESLRGFGLSRLGSDSCSGSEEQLYSCSSSSDASVYFDVEPYFGDVDFHCRGEPARLGRRDRSPEHMAPTNCRNFHISLVQPRHMKDTLTEKYISRAAELVSSLSIEKPKPEKADCEDFILFYEEKEEEEKEEEPKLRRASSLKSPGSPPPPGEKKIVRFADVLGLDLTDVRTFLDEVPKVPKSAFKDLEGVEVSPSPVGSPFKDGFLSARSDKSVVPLFQQPFTSPHFMDKLRRDSVCLESASITDTNLFMITGVVRVVNLGFQKGVTVRYSQDCWKTSTDLTARYVNNSCDGFSDKFSFTLYANSLKVGDRLEFALKYSCNGKDFWDNNGGANYSFQCVPAGPPKPITSAYLPSPLSFDTWASFY